MSYTRVAILAALAAGAALAPISDVSARCWRWHCGPPPAYYYAPPPGYAYGAPPVADH